MTNISASAAVIFKSKKGIVRISQPIYVTGAIPMSVGGCLRGGLRFLWVYQCSTLAVDH